MVIKVPIVLTYNNKGSKQAQRDIRSGANGIEKAFKKMGLASKLSIAGITASLSLLAKQSLAAAIAEEKQSKALQQTLKNLGKSYEQVPVAEFVNKLQFATGVSEDQLRPALQRLLTVTNNVAKSQQLLQLALNVSAGTGKDLQSVVNALSRAYLGNNSSLSRLGVNLTKAELKVASFEQITNKLANTYANQASQAATTFGGKLAILGVAADEAKEKLGVALLDSIENLSKDGFDGLSTSINKSADALVGLTEVTAKSGLLQTFKELNSEALRLSIAGRVFDRLAEIGATASAERITGTPPQQSELATQRRQIADAKVQIALAKKLRLESEKKAKAERDATASKRLAAKFDEQNIQIQAALKGKLDEQELVRLKALIALKSESKADDLKALEELETAQKNAAAAELARIREQAAAGMVAVNERKAEIIELQKQLQEQLDKSPLSLKFNKPMVPYAEGFLPQKENAPPPLIAAPALPPTNVSPTTPTAPPSTNVSPQIKPPQFLALGGSIIQIDVNAGTIADPNQLSYIIGEQVNKYVRSGGSLNPAGLLTAD